MMSVRVPHLHEIKATGIVEDTRRHLNHPAFRKDKVVPIQIQSAKEIDSRVRCIKYRCVS